MKVMTLVLLVFVTAFVGSAAPAPPPQATFAEFTGTETFDPFNILSPTPVGYYVDTGTVACPGHEPTGLPLQPCPAGSQIHARDAEWVSRVDAGPPLGGGWMTVRGNANLGPDFTGTQWGTFSLALDAGGTFSGTWQATRTVEGTHWVSFLHASGRGSGEVDGQRILVDERILTYTPIPVAYVSYVEGRVVAPHGD